MIFEACEFLNMMHDGDTLSLKYPFGAMHSVGLVCIKVIDLWHFSDLGQSYALNSCCVHARGVNFV